MPAPDMAIDDLAIDDLAIDVRDLVHRYDSPSGALTVLDGVSFSVTRRSIVVVTGASGSGKTTLLSVLGGLEHPQHGMVEVDGHDLGGLTGDDLAAYRRTTVGFVFQDFGLLGQLTAMENVELALTFGRVPRSRRRARARDLLAAVGLGARLDHRPAALSGGESQRVAIARALANEPTLVLADEPTGNLDSSSTGSILDYLSTLPTDHGCTLVIVTHDPIVAERATVSLQMVDGKLVA